MKKLLWIVPNLDENLRVLKSSLKRYHSYSRDNDYSSQIIISEAGSKLKNVREIVEFSKRISLPQHPVAVELCLPFMHPNKNLGILNIVQSHQVEYVIVIDADWVNAGRECLNSLIGPLIENEADISLPTLTQRRSGRINRLVVTPLLSLFYPQIARKIPFPLAGMLGIRYEYLREIASSPDYFWDWGGEAQIVIRGFRRAKGKVHTFEYPKKESKKRRLVEKMKDACQITRTILYEAFRDKKLSGRVAIKEHLLLLWDRENKMTKSFLEWQKRHNISFIQNRDELEEKFETFTSRCRKDPRWLPDFLQRKYQEIDIYEFLVLKEITSRSVLKVLFDIRLAEKPKEVSPEDINRLQLAGLSMVAAFIFAIYIHLWLEKEKEESMDFKYFVRLLSSQDTDFVEVERLRSFRQQGLKSVDVLKLNSDGLEKILSLFHNPKQNPIQKNKSLLDIL